MDLTNIKWENGFSALNPDSIPPESVLLPYSKPLLFPESTRNTLVICLHGWRASPYEAIPIAKAVQSKGFAASVPLLPGHGIKDLNFAKKYFLK